MKLKQATRYAITNMRTSALLFCFIIIGIYLVFGTLIVMIDPGEGSISLDGSFIAYIFIMGAVFFLDSLKFFLQNGISRKTMFFSFICSFSLLSMFMAFVNTIIYLLSTKMSMFSSVLPLLYGVYLDGFSLPVRLLFVFLNNVSMMMIFAFMGIFGSSFFSRLSKYQKVIVPVGTCLLVVCLIFLNQMAGGVIGDAVIKFFTFISGMRAGGNINYLTVSFTVAALILAGLFWLTIRRATIKN